MRGFPALIVSNGRIEDILCRREEQRNITEEKRIVVWNAVSSKSRNIHMSRSSDTFQVYVKKLLYVTKFLVINEDSDVTGADILHSSRTAERSPGTPAGMFIHLRFQTHCRCGGVPFTLDREEGARPRAE